MLLAVSPYVTVMDGEEPFEATVRYRTVGDMNRTLSLHGARNCFIRTIISAI